MAQLPAALATLIAIDDQARPDRRAVAFARQLVANTSVRLEVLALAPHGDRVPVIRDRLAHREGSIVVLDVHGGGFRGDLLFDEDAEDTLEHVPMPALTIGPAATVPAAVRTLVVATDEHTPLDRPLDVAAGWSASLGAANVVIAHLHAPMTWPHETHADDSEAAAAMAARGLDGSVQLIPTLEPWEALRDTLATHDDAIAVITTRRWPGADHWFSTARALIRPAS